MKIKDLGPFAVFRMGGRVYVNTSGLVRLLDRSGSMFEPIRDSRIIDPETEVDAVDLTSPLAGQGCAVCFGGGYEPGKYDNYERKRCPNGCLVEGRPDPVVERPKGSSTCECCNQPLFDCEKGVRTEEQVSG